MATITQHVLDGSFLSDRKSDIQTSKMNAIFVS